MSKKNVFVSVIIGLLIVAITGSIFAFPRPNTPSQNPIQNQGAVPPGMNRNYQKPGFGGFHPFGLGLNQQPIGLGLGRFGGAALGLMVDRELVEARVKLGISEALSAMNLSKEQAKAIYNILSQTKEEIQKINDQILEEYQKATEAAVNKDTEILNKSREMITTLLQKRLELVNQATEKIKSQISVEQLEQLMKYFGQRLRERIKNQYGYNAKFGNVTPNATPNVQERFRNLLKNRHVNFATLIENARTRGRMLGILFTDQFLEVLKMYAE